MYGRGLHLLLVISYRCTGVGHRDGERGRFLSDAMIGAHLEGTGYLGSLADGSYLNTYSALAINTDCLRSLSVKSLRPFRWWYCISNP